MLSSEDIAKQEELGKAWDQIAVRMELYPEFYEFVADAAKLVDLPSTASIADTGCGTGRLLSALAARGYTDLTGVDFSLEATNLTHKRAPITHVQVHNIVQAPLPVPFDAVFMTEVIEHLTEPERALANLYASVKSGGYLFLSFPNRHAYWPLSYLAWVRHLVHWSPRLTHWVTWFTMPYELRSDQPVDHAYSSRDVRRFIEGAGFHILRQRGMRFLPMFRISGLGFLTAFVEILERLVHKLPFQWYYYRSMFICRKDD